MMTVSDLKTFVFYTTTVFGVGKYSPCLQIKLLVALLSLTLSYECKVHNIYAFLNV